MGGVFARAIDGGRMDAGWADALAPVADDLERLERRLTAEQQAGRAYLPAGDLVLRAFEQPFDAVRVLLLGQDPYPTPGHPLGLAFAVDRGVRPLPRSLGNILRERESDLGIPPSAHGDLSAWSRQGVLLLNRVLTVQPGQPGSHRGWGWETVTARAIEALAGRDAPLVAILWGREAAQTVPLLGATPMILSAHPSPLSAHRGFFGSRPFSRANALLESAGAAPIDWRLDGETGRG